MGSESRREAVEQEIADAKRLADSADAESRGSRGCPELLSRVRAIHVLITDGPAGLTPPRVTRDLHTLARAALQPDLVAVLDDAGGANDTAFQLVLRDLTTVQLLARALYRAKPDPGDRDPTILALSSLFSSHLGLFGAMDALGISMTQPWAKHLAFTVKTLPVYQHTSWNAIKRLAVEKLLPNLESPTARVTENPANSSDSEQQPTPQDPSLANHLSVDGQLVDAWMQIIPGERKALERLYAMETESAPPIRRQLLECGIGMDAVDELERENVSSAEKISEQLRHKVSKLLSEDGAMESKLNAKLRSMSTNVAEKKKMQLSPEEEQAAQEALQARKEQLEALEALRQNERETNAANVKALSDALDAINVDDLIGKSREELSSRLEEVKGKVAPPTDFGKVSFTGSAALLDQATASSALGLGSVQSSAIDSYGSNEELVASASGGMAMYGISFFPDSERITRQPHAPLLQKPEFVEMSGPAEGFVSRVYKTTSEAEAQSFNDTARSAGMTMAESSSTSWGASASVSGGFGGFAASASASHSASQDTKDSSSTQVEQSHSSTQVTKTQTAILTEYIKCPMRSFRIPETNMKLSDEALERAKNVRTLLDAEEFLDTFGSHVSLGRHLLGGVFFRTISMRTTQQQDASKMFAACGETMSTEKGKARSTSASASAGGWGVTASVSASFSSATRTGSTSFSTKAASSGAATASIEAFYETNVHVMGPNAPTPEDFATLLFANNSTWFVMDRGPYEALAPVWRILDRTIGADTDSLAGGEPSEQSKLLRTGWQRRARKWQPYLEGSPFAPYALKTLIRSSFIAVDTIQNLIKHLPRLFERSEKGTSSDVEGLIQFVVDIVEKAALQMAREFPTSDSEWGMRFLTKLRSAMTTESLVVIAAKDKNDTIRLATDTVIEMSHRLSGPNWDSFAGAFVDKGQALLKKIFETYANTELELDPDPGQTVLYQFHAMENAIPDNLRYALSTKSSSRPGWELDGPVFTAHSGPADGLVPLWAYWANAKKKRFMYGTTRGEPELYGWTRDKILCYVAESSASDRVPLRRYYKERPDGWYMKHSVRSAPPEGWTEHHIQGYVWPLPQLPAPDTVVIAKGRDKRMERHQLSRASSLSENILRPHRDGGTVWLAHSKEGPGLVPIVEYKVRLDARRGTYRWAYFTGTNNASGWTRGEIAFYAATVNEEGDREGTIPVYRWHTAENRGWHFEYSTNRLPSSPSTTIQHGAQFNVWPPWPTAEQ